MPDHRPLRQLPLPGMEAPHRVSHFATRPILLLLIVGAATYVLLPQFASLERSVAVVRSLTIWLFALAIVAQFCCYLAHAYSLGAILNLFDQGLSLSRRIGLAMAPYSLSLVWGGQLTSSGASFRWLRRAGIPVEAALITSSLPALINLVSVLFVATFGLVYLLSRQHVSQALVATLLLPLLLTVVLAATTAWILGNRPRFVAFAHRSGSFWARLRGRAYNPAATEEVIDSLFDAWKVLLAGGWMKALVADVMSVVFDVLTLFCVFWAAGYHISPGLLLAGYGLPILAGKLSILPGGVGVIEGGMAALYAALGVGGGVVVVVILGYRLLSFWIPVIVGFGLAVWLDRVLGPEDAIAEPG